MTETAVSSADAAVMERSNKKILIIGCGPAGLIAAHTLEKNGVPRDHFRIISKEVEPSLIGGAQLLHRPIFDEEKPDHLIALLKMGTGEGYAKKVYGDGSVGTSFDKYITPYEIEGWSLNRTYEKLWEEYGPGVEIQKVDADVMQRFLEGGSYDEIICTIPPSAYCSNPAHIFNGVPILLGEPDMEFPMENFICYSGREEDRWYRIANLFGEQSIEFGTGGQTLTQADKESLYLKWLWNPAIEGIKPTGTDCDCGFMHPGGTKLLRVGRFGMWDRKRLLHQVPDQVASII